MGKKVVEGNFWRSFFGVPRPDRLCIDPRLNGLGWTLILHYEGLCMPILDVGDCFEDIIS